MARTRFRSVTPRVPVADLERTIAFYTERLGFRTAVLWPREAPSFCILQRDGIRLGFYVPDSRRGDRQSPGAAELFLDVEGVQALHERLRRDLEIEWGPEVFFYGRREFALRDPEGYLLIFSEQTEDPVTCPEEGGE